MNQNEPLTPDQQEISERNQRALDYLDQKEKMKDELESGRNLMIGCTGVLLFSAIFWYAIITIVKSIIEAL